MHTRPVLALGLAVPALALAVAGTTGAKSPNGDYHAQLVPLNKPGSSGTTDLHRHGDQLDVHVQVADLDGGMHLAHIHGFKKGMSECPGLDADSDGNGLVDFAEGLPSYGGVLRTLSQPGDVGTSLDYSRTFTTLDNGDGAARLGHLDRYVIVIHGVDIDGDGVAANPDAGGAPGPDPAGNEISMPAMCGLVEVAH